nr:SpoIIE family protein phosphatase [uncultured Sellimonas sp.]
MRKGDNKYNHPLGRKVLVGCAVFCIILCFLTGVVGGLNYYSGMIDKYQTYMEGILKYALTEIDADDLENCISSGERSPQYEQTQDVLNRLKEEYQIEYIYIVKPLNTDASDNMMDVMAGVTEYERVYEKDTLTQLGELTGDAYSSEVAGKYLKQMESKNQNITYFFNRTEFGYDYTGLITIKDSSGKSVAVLAVDISINEIRDTLVKYVFIVLVGMIFLIAVFLTALYSWLKKRIIVPISKVKTAAQAFVISSHGQTDPEKIQFEDPQIVSEDEMQALSEAFVTMAADLKEYMRDLLAETKEKERISTELSLATEIQANMLPCIFPAFPERTEFDIYAMMHPAKEVGGDFYDFFLIDEDHLALVIADVSGKGVPAALFMVIAKTLIKNQALTGESPAQILRSVNEQLCEGNEAELFVTVWLGIIQISTGKGIAANAGHEHPVIRRKDGKFELVIYRHSPAVAVMEGMNFREHEFELYPGDTLFVYTDGVPEATDSQNKLFGNERMLNALNKNPDAKPEELLKNVKEEVDLFTKEVPQFDDVTMLGIKYYGETGNE